MKREVFRAKEPCSGEYMESDSQLWVGDKYYLGDGTSNNGFIECDPTTRSVNFPDMLDKNNKPIFASLSKDRKGGDLVEDVLINFDYDEWIIRSTVFFDKPSCGVLFHNFFERTKKKGNAFATEQKPKVKYSDFTGIHRPEVIGIYEGDRYE